MSNDTAKTITTNIVPVQGTFEPLPPYECINLIGPAGTPFYAPVNPNLDGVNITNSTINSTTIGVTTPAAGAFTTASATNQPIGNNDLTTKLYVDSLALGISWKQPVNAATTANITLSGAQTIDTVPVVAGDRVLVKNQNTQSENGIYIVGTPWTRSPDANAWDELVSALVFVESGSQAGSAWYCPVQPGGTLGVTAVTWNNFSVGGVYFAGTGLNLSGGDTFNITNTGVTAATYGSASTVPAIAVNLQGQITSATNTNIAIDATAITSGTVDSARISGNYSGITGVGTLTNLTVSNTITGSISGNAATATNATNATTATNLAGGATGSVPYQSGSGATTFVGIGSTGQILTVAGGVPTWAAPATNGDVVGPASSTDNAIARFDSTTGKVIQNSTVTLSDPGALENVNEIQFDTTPTSLSNATGSLWFNSTLGTLSYRLDSGGYTSQINEQQFVYGKASAAITKGQLVVKTGVVGASGVIQFAPSTAGITDGNAIVGVAYENIANNGFGRVVSLGLLEGINTSAYANNDTLWYDPAGSGAMTATKPSAPNLKAEIGIVINAGSGGSGSMYVKIFPGSQLGGTDQNVQLTAPISDNSLLQYYTAGGYWRNVASSTVSVGAATNLSGGATGSLPYQSSAGTTTFLAAGTDGQVLKLASGVPSWSSDTSGVTITDDTTTNATRYITFSNQTTGNETTLDVSSTKLQFNPSSGLLTATGFSGSGSSLTNVVTTFSAGTTGLTPNSATSGAVTLGGTLAIANGGTGQTTATAAFNALNPMTTTGDIIYEASPTTAARLGIGSTGQVLTVSGGIPAWATPSSGAVVQVKSTTKTDIFSSSSTSFVDITGFNVSITPTSSSNKVLVTATFTVGSDLSTVFLGFRLVRGSTVIYVGDAAGSRTQASGGAGRVNEVSDTYSINFNFLDSPATTSSTTYKVQGLNNNPNTWYVGSNGLNANNAATGRYPTTITVMEVTP